ncbi:MAG: WecB/TagA/CpsF family glycosyltransferase [Anaerolineales bacterium]|nr:WecB/TagA/CpsF family glycosyltransferase [Anaerolineales bacterium]
MKNLSCTNILGVNINTMTMNDALAQICHWIQTGQRRYVSVCTVHTVMECYVEPQMRAAVNGAGMATPDGMPLVFLGKLRGKTAVERVYGPDLMLSLCQLSVEEGYRHFFYGGAEGVPERLAQRLEQLYPGLQIAGGYSPPFRPLNSDEESAILNQINESGADIVWVGLGTPKQDLWMARYREQLKAPVLIGVGAAFDFHTGQVRQAPRWMQRLSLEWFFRLLMEPRRLWRRYLIYNPWFLWLVCLQLTGLRKFPTPVLDSPSC